MRPMPRVRALALFCISATALALPAPWAGGSALPGRVRNLTCRDSIAVTQFPYLGSSRPQDQNRLVLGVASVPPAYLGEVVATDDQPWRYWRKAGLVIRSGSERVTLSVPKEWQSRAAIVWGNGGDGVFSSVRIAGCGSDPRTGNAYAGGFYLRSSSACLPLLVRVGTRTATVRFGIGRRCP
jgi:hypothetical protein